MSFVFLQRANGICPSTLIQSPVVSVGMAMIDWLHTMDHGVLADISVNVLLGRTAIDGCSKQS